MATSSARPGWLVLSAFGDLAIAFLHVAIVAVGPRAYIYFGAASLAEPARRGELWPAGLTLTIAIVFAIWGCFALAGAGVLPRVPLLRTVLVLVSALYLLRGLIVIPDLIRLCTGAGYPLRQTVFSASALALGLTHSLGTGKLFRRAVPSTTGVA